MAVEAKRREEEAWLASPEAAQEREDSQDAFAEVSGSEAKDLLVEAFPEAMAGLNEDPGRVMTGLKVEKVLGPHAAVVGDGHGGERRLVETSLPIESELGGEGRKPVDLALEPSGGGYVPSNPVAELELPSTAAGSIQLGEGVAVRIPADNGHEAVPLGEENLFIPETEPSTDTLLSPIGRGVEISEQLRSAESPHELTFELELPEGAGVKAKAEGGAEVLSRAGELLEEVPPPSAVDAQGAAVPVEMQVEGDDLVLDVAGESGSAYAYPILVDPEFVTEGGYLPFFGEDPGEGYTLRDLGSSLNAYSEPNRWYGANTYAQWVYTAPGETAFLGAGYFNPVYFLTGGCNTAQPHGYIGLYNVYKASYDALGVFSGGSSESTYETGWNGGFGDRFATIGIGAGSEKVEAISCYHEIYVGGYLIQIEDEDRPTWNSFPYDTPWMKDTPAPIPVSATDTGLGVKAYYIETPNAGNSGWELAKTELSCEGTRASSCPRTWEPGLTDYRPQFLGTGEVEVGLYAEDPVENVSFERPVWIRVDHTPPALTLSGPLTTQTTLGMGKPEYGLRWHTEDGVAGKQNQSGVASVVVKVDGTVVHSETPGCSGSTNCSTSGEWNFVAADYGEGKHEVTVISTDAVGNEATRTLHVSDSPEVTSPESGERTSTRLKLTAAWRQSGYSHITWQYRLGTEGTWTEVPRLDAYDASGEPVAWPAAVEGQESRPLWWNVAASSLSTKDIIDLEVRAILEGGSNPVGESLPVPAKLNRASGGPKDASSPVGPGNLDLVTGNLSVPRTDVSIPVFGTSLEFSRTYNSKEAEKDPTGILGPGWIAGSPVEEAGGADWKFVRDAEAAKEGPYAIVTDLEGYEYPFERLADGEYLAPPEAAGWKLSREGSTFVLADPEGNRTEFGSEAEPDVYLPTAVTQPGGTAGSLQMVRTQMAYELTGSNRRLKVLIGPSAEGVTCSPAGSPPAATSTLGCRSLSFTYEKPSEWGGSEGMGDRLTSITYNGPSGTGEGHWEAARYVYDHEGRLTEEWDPRIEPPLKEAFAYAGGQLHSVTPAGQEPWVLGYEEEPQGQAHAPTPGEGPIAAYSFDEGAGTVADDATGDGHEGTVEGAQWVPGKFGESLQFGEDWPSEECVKVPGSSELQLSEGFTLEAWIRPEGGYEGQDPIIFKELEPGSNYSYAMGLGLSSLGRVEGWTNVEGEEEDVRSPGHIEEDIWTHVAYTYDGQNMRLFVDGAKVAEEHVGPEELESSGALLIGCSGMDPEYEEQFKGRIDEVRIYDRALGEGKIAEDQSKRIGEAPEHLRLHTVRRASLAGGSEPATAQTTIAYGVPLEGGSAPYAMGKAEVAEWGEKDVPVAATAIFPPDEVPTGRPTGFARATIFYTDDEGQLVNTASPSGAGPLEPAISTTEQDEFGNVVRELSIDNRLRALAGGSESVGLSEELDTERTYNSEGTELLDEKEPLHEVRLQSGSTVEARLHDVITYEDQEPTAEEEEKGASKPHLPTKEVAGAEIPGEAEAERQITEYRYDWKLRKLTDTIVDPVGLDIQTKTIYDDATGLPVKQSQPSDPEGKGAGTTETVYYSAGGGGECGGKPQYAGLPCKVTPVAQVEGTGRPKLLVRKFPEYNQLGDPTEIVESPGGGSEHLRTTKITYDRAGRQVTGLIEGGGEAVPKTRTLYSERLGLPTGQEFVCEIGCAGFERDAVSTTYDRLGRVTEYEDATGNVAKTTYDIDGRPVASDDAKGTRTITYDPTSGLPTKLEDSGAGTFSATYDAEGEMVSRTLPDGLTAETGYNVVGEPMQLVYEKKTSCGESCTWFEEGVERTIYGQILTDDGTLVKDSYSYDKDGRLTEAQETAIGGSCATRSYTYDADSNRIAKTTVEGTGGCATKGGTTQKYGYDAADRLEGEGLTYDSFGRITTLPAPLAGGSKLETTFFANEMVATQSQNGVTDTSHLDSTLRDASITQTGGGHEGKEVFHFDGPGDSPAWTERGSTWTRNIVGLGGQLAAVQESPGNVTFKVIDLHGDVVASASASPTATTLLATYRFDEFGEPIAGAAERYGWLGGRSRRTEFPSGVIQMGVRSYIPQLGRFLTPDPVSGGSANPYDYAGQDPVNKLDLRGEKLCSRVHGYEVCANNATGLHNKRLRAQRLYRREKANATRAAEAASRTSAALAHHHPVIVASCHCDTSSHESGFDSIINGALGSGAVIGKDVGGVAEDVIPYQAAIDAFKFSRAWNPASLTQWWQCSWAVSAEDGSWKEQCDPLELILGEPPASAR
ncbi:MAG TPA: LamG-like jellyroll fold domain-containing protein [Solirubrobacterales bacterium]